MQNINFNYAPTKPSNCDKNNLIKGIHLVQSKMPPCIPNWLIQYPPQSTIRYKPFHLHIPSITHTHTGPGWPDGTSRFNCSSPSLNIYSFNDQLCKWFICTRAVRSSQWCNCARDMGVSRRYQNQYHRRWRMVEVRIGNRWWTPVWWVNTVMWGEL